MGQGPRERPGGRRAGRAFLPQTRSLCGSRRRHLLRRDPRPCWDFFLLPFPSCCQHRGWAGCGRAAFCLGRAPSAFGGRLWPRAPPWVSGRRRRLLPPPGRGPSAAVPASPRRWSPRPPCPHQQPMSPPEMSRSERCIPLSPLPLSPHLSFPRLLILFIHVSTKEGFTTLVFDVCP